MTCLTTQDTYRTPERKILPFARWAPGWAFYTKMVSIVWRASRWAKKGEYTSEKWIRSSVGIVRALESVGVKFEVENLTAFKKLQSPCVFIGNHMSTLETFVLPCIIRPYLEIAFVVKEDLVKYPFFKHVMISTDPIVVTRTDARSDLRAVLDRGQERLRRNISVIIFPQKTRTVDFNPKQFNTIGIKLAKRAGTPIVPFALKTNAWGNGRRIKDFGKIDPSKTVHIRFGDPMTIKNHGKEEHEFIIRFIQDKLRTWA